MDTNAKISSLHLVPPARAITSSDISVQRLKLSHFKEQLLVLFEQLTVETILSTYLFLESLYFAVVPL